MRLFCFPCAGGGTGLYVPWRARLAPQIEICAARLPGREMRYRERPIACMEQLVSELIDAMLPLLDRPYALFGHSLGASVAYEVAKSLIEKGLALPKHLFVSARRVPHRQLERPPIASLSDREFLEVLRGLGGTPSQVLDDCEILRAFLPSLRVDFTIADRYTGKSLEPIPIPITGLCGDADSEANLADMAEWADYSFRSFESKCFQGDHFYLKPQQDAVLAQIKLALSTSGSSD